MNKPNAVNVLKQRCFKEHAKFNMELVDSPEIIWKMEDNLVAGFVTVEKALKEVVNFLCICTTAKML